MAEHPRPESQSPPTIGTPSSGRARLAMAAAGLAALTLALEVARRVAGARGTWTDVALPLVILGALGTGAGPVRTRPGLQRWIAGVTLALATVLSAVVFGRRP